jgi:Domain of unknown function (DUF4157)
MFASPVAKAKTKPAELHRSAIPAQRPSWVAVAQGQLAQRTIGSRAMQRFLAQRERVTRNEPGAHGNEANPATLAGQKAAPGLTWDFNKIPIFAPGESSQSRIKSVFTAPQISGLAPAKLSAGKVEDPLEHEPNTVADQGMRMPDPDVFAAATPPQVNRQCAACEEEQKPQKEPTGPQAAAGGAPSIVDETLRSPGQPLDAATIAFMGPRFGHNFSQVRVHADGQAANSARSVNALAYTVGNHIVFGGGQYQPQSSVGQLLLAHELVHVVQQRTYRAETAPKLGESTAGESQEAEADRAASAAMRGTSVPSIRRVTGAAIQRKVEMRDVGRGDQSGFARLPELVDRLNSISQGLRFSVHDGGELAYQVRDSLGHLVPAHHAVELGYEVQAGKSPSNFDSQMKAFIDQDPVIPLRLTNRHSLLGDPAHGFHVQVDVDAWVSGYVDIDDLLASSDLGLQSVLVHFLRERSATAMYSQRIGGANLSDAEFNRAHDLGIEAEAQLLRDFFGDLTIRIVSDSPSPTIRRVFRNSRRDIIRRRVSHGSGPQRGVDASSIEVVTRDGVTHTAEEYREILEREHTARQVEGERLRGAAEHFEGGHAVPPP